MLVKAQQHQNKRIKCSLGDHFVFRMPVSIAFFYPKSIPSELIINSLQQVLKDFPLFAGVLIRESGQLYIDCNNQGVQVNIEHSNHTLQKHLSNLSQLNPGVFVDTINPRKNLKHGGPVFTLKLHYFADGMSMGCCWNHSIGDMSTLMAFLKALSAQAQGKSYELPIIVEDRQDSFMQWLKETPKSNRECRFKPLNVLDLFRFIKQKLLPKKIVHLHFSQEEIVALRDALSANVGYKLTRNESLCAFLLNKVAQCRTDKDEYCNASIVINYRSRIGMPLNVLGNYVSIVPIRFAKKDGIDLIADAIHSGLNTYSKNDLEPSSLEKFIQENGGLRKIDRLVPQIFLPQHKNFLLSNWSNFGVYSIDFGIAAPFLFLPVGKPLMPWVGCIVEGFNNNGLLASVIVPAKIASKLAEIFNT